MKITLSEFEPLLEEISFPLAVATSGGSDSLALLILAHQVAQKRESYVTALTVDHGLRTESKIEALRVQEWAKEKGIRHVILKWEGEKPLSRLHEKAREARYNLLTEWCKNNNISTLLLGHHQQDQEETFWMRLAAGSGLDGLSGMKKQLVREGIVLFRPLLGFSKERLQATLKAENQDWIEDPSNRQVQFLRGRLRPFLAEEGLSSVRLMKIMEKLGEDANFIQGSLYKALEEMVCMDEGGFVRLKKEAFENLHPALSKRVIALLMQWFSGAKYPPRSDQVVTILNKIKAFSPFTAGGIYWLSRKDEILLLREESSLQKNLFTSSLIEKKLWDQRFWIDPQIRDYVPRDTYFAALRSFSSFKDELTSSIPSRAWSTLPALWIKGKVVAIPHLGYTVLNSEKDLQKFISLKPLFHDSLRLTI